jgi:hypothetical protein
LLALPFAATATLEDRQRLLQSVIGKLDATVEVSQSAAAALAYAMRAKLWLEAGQDPTKTIADALHCLSLAAAPRETRKIAFRALADARERSGNIQGAIEALLQWASEDPSYRTKVNKEIQRLSS